MEGTHPYPEDTEFYRAALHDIIGLANDLARRIHAAATGDQPTLTLEEASIAFDRTARALRRTILLAQRLDQVPDTASPARAARKQVIRQVEDAIFRESREKPERKDPLTAEFEERLDRPEFADDIATRPVADFVKEICRDLGIQLLPGARPNWKRRTPDDIAHLAAKAARAPMPDPWPERPGPPPPRPSPAAAPPA